MKKKYLLEVRNLSCERNYKLLFKKISFKLFPGKLVLINGNNGSGKTSLLLCIAEVLNFKGQLNINLKQDHKLGYVGHLNAANEIETVEDFLIFWKNVYNFVGDIKHIVNYFNLKKYLEQPINLLSFGQKKKLSFARLIMANAKIWLLDEPISGLDTKTKDLILNLIKRHCKDGGGIIATSHQNLEAYDKKKVIRINID